MYLFIDIESIPEFLGYIEFLQCNLSLLGHMAGHDGTHLFHRTTQPRNDCLASDDKERVFIKL